ncbi:hypothetical protein BaRGS_00025597 [Batillaria attramentaria]|uniref:EGF-like domain-containing protein n=1 Tax=Batillaria attramentaria TaxID=370345 RepID=A0ABD0K7Y6_9CAEN
MAFALKALVLQLFFNHAYSISTFELRAGCDAANCPGKCTEKAGFGKITCECPPGHMAWGLGCFTYYFKITVNCYDFCLACQDMYCFCDEDSFAQGQQCVKKVFSLPVPCSRGENCGVYGYCTGGSTCECIEGFVVKPEYPDRCLPGAGKPYDRMFCDSKGCYCNEDTMYMSPWDNGTDTRCYCMYGKSSNGRCRRMRGTHHH